VTFFLALGIAGMVLVLLSLVVGDLLDGVLDALEADWLSTAVVGGFVSAFGFGGAAAEGIGLPWPLAVLVGGVSGVAVGWLAWWMTRLLKDGPSDGTVSISDSVGQVGRVLTDIPSGGFGVVRIVVGGHSLQVNASADRPIPSGAEVDVTGVLSPTAVKVVAVWKP
jgi:membrane-bound ClpP family serine protease